MQGWKDFLLKQANKFIGEVIILAHDFKRQNPNEKIDRMAAALNSIVNKMKISQRFFYWRLGWLLLRTVWLVRRMEETGQLIPEWMRDHHSRLSPLDENKGRRPKP